MKKIFASIVLVFVMASVVFAASCCNDVPTVDGDDAHKRSQRRDRDPIEGLWTVSLDWHPERLSALSYNVAIVQNEYDVFKDSDYVGATICKNKNSICVNGEVKMFFYRTPTPGEYNAVMVTSVGYARGKAYLTDDDGRPNSLIDMSRVTLSGRRMAASVRRVKGK